jgi:hypothetical protein
MKTTLTVRFISGREEKFETDLWGGSGAQARFTDFVSNPTIVLQLETELLVIPASAIECVSLAIPEDPEDKVVVGTLRKGKRIKIEEKK